MAKSNNFDCNLIVRMGVAVGEGNEMKLFNGRDISIGGLAKGEVTTIPVGITGEKDREQR